MNTSSTLLPRIDASKLGKRVTPPVTPLNLEATRAIVSCVRDKGADGVRLYASQFNERAEDEPLLLGPDCMRSALNSIPGDQRRLLERTAERIRRFAQAQRDAISSIDIEIPGGRAGHTVEPVESAGCYAPGGRYPLVSSVLMTAVTARVAGCRRVVVASPGAPPLMLAAAAIAGADEFLAVGGAHAIAALAFGISGLEPVDVIVGPGNRWVTAAKYLVSDSVGIDMLAGPSELLIVADETADAATVAADFLAQAEHDTDAIPMLVTTSPALQAAVDAALSEQIATLPSAATARVALANGFSCLASNRAHALDLADAIAAEHVEIMVQDAESFASSLTNAGAVFLGSMSAEVLGDFGAGPNHTLPTGGTARFQAGLSVSHFIRLRTWIRMSESSEMASVVADAAALARIEGLPGHERAANRRALSDALK